MIPKLKDLTEPGPGSSVWELMDDDHYWWRDTDGTWHCSCPDDQVQWTWAELVDDIGPDSTSYIVEAAR
jgi:hypothetical protein